MIQKHLQNLQQNNGHLAQILYKYMYLDELLPHVVELSLENCNQIEKLSLDINFKIDIDHMSN